MTKPTVVVLSSHTLFAEGVTSRLQLRDEALNLSVIDARSSDAMDQIITVVPDAVIVDASDKEAGLNCPINELLAAVPALKIIRLDPEQSGFQVVTSAQHIAHEVDDLLEVIIGEENRS
jgi:DNA-binding NarL/FixJ family response regulator